MAQAETLAGAGVIAHSQERHYRQQIHDELHREFVLEPAEAKASRAARRKGLETQHEAIHTEPAKTAAKVTAERERLHGLQALFEGRILTDTEEHLVEQSARIQIAQKRIAALESQHADQQAAVETIVRGLAALDKEAVEAEQHDSSAALINKTTAEYLQAVEAILGGLKRLPLLYRRLADSNLSEPNRSRCAKRADIFVQDYRKRIIEDCLRDSETVWNLLQKVRP